MALRPLPRITGTDPVVIAPDILQSIIDELVRLGKVTAIPPLMVSDDETGLVFSVRGTGTPLIFPVRVEQTGGTQGTPTTRATWTYTVRDFTYTGELASGEDDPILGTGVVVADPRPIGRMIVQDGDTGIGWAFYDTDGTLKLWDAGEREDTGFCSQLESPDASGS